MKGNVLRRPWFGLRGILFALRTELASQIQAASGAILLLVAWFVHVPQHEFLLLVCVISVVLAVEFINTALEHLCNMVHPTHNERIGLIKDLGAGASFTVGVAALVVVCVILTPYIRALI